MSYLINWLYNSIQYCLTACFNWFYDSVLFFLNFGYRIVLGIWGAILFLVNLIFNVIFWTIDGCLYLTVQTFRLVFNEGQNLGLASLMSTLKSSLNSLPNNIGALWYFLFDYDTLYPHFTTCLTLILGFYSVRFVLHVVRG